MPIKQPGRVLLHDIPLRFVKSRVSGGGRKGVDIPIALIPFIDFLIVLVVFLLMSFGSTELLAQQPNLKMPTAAHVVDLELAPIIAINAQVVTLDGMRVADTQTLAASPQVEPVDQIVQMLTTLSRNWSIAHPRDPFPAAVVLQADQHTDYRVIKKVMFSASQAGYANISFAVNRNRGQ